MLTQKGKYAIKALIYMAEKGVLVKTQDIADSAQIPKKFLEAILLELKRHGFVESIEQRVKSFDVEGMIQEEQFINRFKQWPIVYCL